MPLNDYRDEAGRFLQAIGAENEPVERKMEMLRQELDCLEASAHDAQMLHHQVYDGLFLLFEIAWQHGVDLDAQWLAGQSRKREKYL